MHKGARVRELRQALGWTLGELSRRADRALGGVSPPTLSDYEHGRVRLSEAAARRVAIVLNVGVGEIWDAPPAQPQPGGLDRLLAEGRIQRRHRNALARAGITVERLLTLSGSEILALPGVGRTALGDIERLQACPPAWALEDDEE